MTARQSGRGRDLNARWSIGARHALYRKNGTWYHLLEEFPGALIDANGYILFKTKRQYLTCSGLHIGTRITIREGISRLPGYVRKDTPVVPHWDPLAEALSAARSLHNVSKTVQETLIEARLGQGRFRQELVAHWKGCAVTGCRRLEALRASHIKPWKNSNNRERLDPFNGLLLLGTLDALFDAGLISFSNSGTLLRSPILARAEYKQLGLYAGMKLKQVSPKHRPYLQWHRSHVFSENRV